MTAAAMTGYLDRFRAFERHRGGADKTDKRLLTVLSVTPQPVKKCILSEPPPLHPDDRALLEAYLNAINEHESQRRAAFIAATRDPDGWQWLYAECVRLGIATFKDVPPPAPHIEEAPTRMAVCARCGYFQPDQINPKGGLGKCLRAAPASVKPGSCWPWAGAEIRCREFEEVAP